jgi:hypothetical protein
MAFRYTIVPAKWLILVRFDGQVSDREFVASTKAICSDPRYVWGFDGLIDLTGVAVAVTTEEIKKLVDYTLSKRKHGHGKWAVLVSTPAATAYAMLYQDGVSREHPFSLFCSWKGASEFLGIEMDAESFQAALAETAS